MEVAVSHGQRVRWGVPRSGTMPPDRKGNQEESDVPFEAIDKFSCCSEQPSTRGNGVVYSQPRGTPRSDWKISASEERLDQQT